jgi:hypothetical protein
MRLHPAIGGTDDSSSDLFKKFSEHSKNNGRGICDKGRKRPIVDPTAVCFFNDPFKTYRGLIVSDPKPGLIFLVIKCFPNRRIFQASGNVDAEKVRNRLKNFGVFCLYRFCRLQNRFHTV